MVIDPCMKRIDLEIGDLQAFVAVAEKLSFRAAADTLFISQPALSRRIDKVETTLGSRLLERTSRRVALTEAGNQFLAHARAAIDEMQAAIDGLSAGMAHRSSQVTIACVPSVANHVLPGAVKLLVEEFPAVRVRVIDESGDQVLKCVCGSAADFGVNFVGAQDADIDFKAIYTERYVVAVPRGHPLAQQASVAWKELRDARLISVSARSSNRVLLDNALARVKEGPALFCEVNHVTGALAMAAGGLGLAVVPNLALSGALYPSLAGVPLTHPAVSRTLGLIKRKGSVLHAPAQALFDILVKMARKGFRP
jgi:DNA-binding transcriptional LysR family regulator